ncbi:DNA polymerase I [Cucumis melo var. makuwa]|uniref:DNA polymerase I n=1 Tax=Cucumis melo var. makuwa TaxID=1194695 RepID=A0A5A7V357_CUCMM|nr:DNA polymerase I [Cucumis melo var. makuwa]TYK27391.1 DNA polymerase I [Cucumis melo var. makuwa]
MLLQMKTHILLDKGLVSGLDIGDEGIILAKGVGVGVVFCCFPRFLAFSSILGDLHSRSGMVSFGLEDFADKFGVLEPSQFVDVMSLVGDKSDNIPGNKGGKINHLVKWDLVSKTQEDGVWFGRSKSKKLGHFSQMGLAVLIRGFITLLLSIHGRDRFCWHTSGKHCCPTQEGWKWWWQLIKTKGMADHMSRNKLEEGEVAVQREMEEFSKKYFKKDF